VVTRTAVRHRHRSDRRGNPDSLLPGWGAFVAPGRLGRIADRFGFSHVEDDPIAADVAELPKPAARLAGS